MKTVSTPKEKYKFNPNQEWPGSLSLLGQALKAVRDKPDFAYLFVGVMGALALLDYIVAPTPFFSFNVSSDTGSPGSNSLLITALTAIVGFVLSAPLTVYQLKLSKNQDVSVSAVINDGLRRILDFIGLNIMIAICVLGGLLLFIVPGIIIGLRLILANYILFDKNVGPVEAFKESFAMTKGNFSEIGGYVGVIILLSLSTGVLSLFVPVFGNMAADAVAIIYGVIGAWLYRWMAKQQ